MKDEEIREPYVNEIKQFLKENGLTNKKAAEILEIKLKTIESYLTMQKSDGYGIRKMPYKSWIILQKKII
jgi:predicted XRE-type DNA-binding protein